MTASTPVHVRARARRVSPVVTALEDHINLCRRCLAVAIANQPATKFCAAGRILSEAALKQRAKRSPS